MALTTRFTTGDSGSIALSPDANISFGTLALGSSYGHVKTAGIKRAADLELIERSNGDVRAALLLNPRFELSLDCLFTLDLDATQPTIGDEIAFPLAGIYGNVLDWDIAWEEKGHRMYKLNATSWDSMIRPVVYEWDDEWAVLYDPAA